MYSTIREVAVTVLWCSSAALVAVPVHAQENAPLSISLTTVTGAHLGGRVELHREGSPSRSILLPSGRTRTEVPAGEYEAYIYAYTRRVAMLVEIMPLSVRPGSGATLEYELLEGTTSAVPLTAFDQDGDRVLDRVEAAKGTDVNDPTSFPGAVPAPFPDRVLSSEAGWYKGELHAHTSHGRGSESVGELIRRAERAGLDFLAITDRNTMAAASDPEFTSDRLVLIPGMEWGSESRGLALIYGPRTLPGTADSMQDAQAILERTQFQGGVFAVAHPCFPHAPWQWGLSYVNAIQVWCRDWRSVPGTSYEALMEPLRARQDGRLVHSIALAMSNPLRTPDGSQSAIPTLSANGQAQRFFDYEVAQGLKAGMIAGSNTAHPSVPIGSPVTYVYAREKSAAGILEGIRLGRTVVARNGDAPRIVFKADAGQTGVIDVGEGGVVPLGMETDFIFQVEGGRGLTVQLLENGVPIRTIDLESNNQGFVVSRLPTGYSVYRIRVFGPAESDGYGPNELYAASSPIYAQSVVPYDPGLGPDAFWLRIDPTNQGQQEPDFTQLESVTLDNLQQY